MNLFFIELKLSFIQKGGGIILRRKEMIYLCSILSFFISTAEALQTNGSFSIVKDNVLNVAGRKEDGQLDLTKPYLIKGVVWNPATRAPQKGINPKTKRTKIDYGFFFDHENQDPKGYEVLRYWLQQEYQKYFLSDIMLMKKMNVNTVRVFNCFSDDPEINTRILDEFFRNNIMVIMTVALTKKDIDDKEYVKVVEMCKDHPAILMWAIGNEWNLSNMGYSGYKTIVKAAKAVNLVAEEIKRMDPYHSVSTVIGDVLCDKYNVNLVKWFVEECTNIDLWGINSYRGKTFGDLFDKWEDISGKPFYFSEFGVDSFMTEKYKLYKNVFAKRCKGEESQLIQSEYVMGLWEEVKNNLSFYKPEKKCIGGLVFSFNDALWKVGSYHSGLGGIINYTNPYEASCYSKYDTEGFYMKNAFPDDVANEEYFGIVNADREPKSVFYALQEFYASL
ncbi:MAG: glycoside hydrolase family 2 TIM barrel-domain containing protein [Candidatus Omnitrophica bacterium]|nr:glycoside hydrolase family 2 TIM barrel-domain containing protein [Candidatus Omnitrophota bacterium]